MRHLQDIVHLMFDLAEAREGFTDAGARDAWMTDPVLVPARENIERIVSCWDWFETVVAVNLVFEPIVGRLMKTELLARNAPRHGDAMTPLVLASANADIERHRAATAELVRLVLADPSHGDGNRVVLAGWLDTWTAESIRAAEALAPLFGAGYATCSEGCEWIFRTWPVTHAGRRQFWARYHGWDLADVIEDLGYVRRDGKTLIGQSALDLDRLRTIDDIRTIGFEVKDPLA